MRRSDQKPSKRERTTDPHVRPWEAFISTNVTKFSVVNNVPVPVRHQECLKGVDQVNQGEVALPFGMAVVPGSNLMAEKMS